MTAITKARFMEGLVLWLPMAEGAGTVVKDQSLFHNNGVFGAGGAAPSWVAGREGLPSVNFGGGDIIEVADAPSLDITDEITINLWVKMVTYPVGPVVSHIIYKPGNEQYDIYINEAGQSASILKDAVGAKYWTTIVGAGGIVLGTDYHLGVTYDGIIARTYFNGMPTPYTNTFTGLEPNNDALRLGAASEHTLDNVLIHNRALDPYEMSSISEMVRKI